MKRRMWMMALVLTLTAASVWAWDGQGTETDPYLVRSTADWRQLAADVSGGNAYAGKVFRMTDDINTGGVMVGNANETPFSGIFDGDGHTLTYAGKYDDTGLRAPFCASRGATFRHVSTTGQFFTATQYAAGLVSMVFGPEATTIIDCKSNSEIVGHSVKNAAHGGLVGAVATGSLTMEGCVFSGSFDSENSAGMVGWSNVDVTIKNSMVDPCEVIYTNGGATFARMAGGAKLSLSECYTTQVIENDPANHQGEVVFRRVLVPEGCTGKIVSEPSVRLNGTDYWTSGAWVELTVPDGRAFDHWRDLAANNALHISDPWTKNGRHQLRDVYSTPSLAIATSAPNAEERTMDGTRYRYLRTGDYKMYVSDETCREKGWELRDGYLKKHVRSGDTDDWADIVAVVGWEQGKIPADGAQIHNDLTGVLRDHTLVGVIAPGAFAGCTELKTLYFKDTDANNKNALQDFDLIIGERAFADCPNLTEVKLMQYTTKGSNSWQIIRPGQVTSIAENAFDGSPQARISCHREVYQQYLSSQTWKPFWQRFIVYDATVEDFNIDGVKYHEYRDKTETWSPTNHNKDVMLDNHVRIWNADYRDFNAADLLDAYDDSQNIYYTSVVGVDDSYMDANDGKMVILNDLGTYYNYKTICLGRSAIAGNGHVRSIEFKQVNGNHTSRSDLMMVIQNGAFRGCTNLKELRMFYYCQDGNDHWEALGPKNVIPGSNIFGIPTGDEAEKMSNEEFGKYTAPLKDFKILVAPDRYNEFLADPNWAQYRSNIQPTDFAQENNADFTIAGQPGITYGYISSPGGIRQTSQTVSQDVSWWTVPRIAIEVAIDILTACSGKATVEVADEAAQQVTREAAQEAINEVTPIATKVSTLQAARESIDSNILNSLDDVWYHDFLVENISDDIGGKNIFTMGLSKTNVLSGPANDSYNFLAKLGMLDKQTGTLASKEVLQKWGEANQEQFTYFLKRLFYNASYDIGLEIDAAEKTIRQAIEKLPFIVTENTVEGINAGLEAYLPTLVQQGTKRVFNKGALAFWAGINTASLLSANSWGGSGSYNADMLNKGMRESILSNIHQVGLCGGGYIITTPQKNLVYHTYIKEVKDDVTEAVVYAGTDKGQGSNASARTMTFGKKAFRDKKNLQKIFFHENNVSTNEALPMLLTIPDSAFVGCTALTELNLILRTDGKGTRALGPENFILAGDSIFAGLDPKQFHIVIDKSRRQDFLFNESWAKLEKYFTYGEAEPNNFATEYGVRYAYAYENNTLKKEHKMGGHLIEHTFINGADNSYLDNHSGTAILINDIGEWNNYQLDYVPARAFRGNDHVRSVQFADLIGIGPWGECYTGLEVTLQDSCFADCRNLRSVDLLYMVTDQPDFASQALSAHLVSNHIDPMTPQMIKAGRGLLAGSPLARFKVMPKQLGWFMADSTWAAYKDRFLPVIIQPSDKGVKAALKDLGYRNKSGFSPEDWDEVIDLSRLPEKDGVYDFSTLDGKFSEQKEDIVSFGDFKLFEHLNMTTVRDGWFEGCLYLDNIQLPATVTTIGSRAFKDCRSLDEIELPGRVAAIGKDAFSGATALGTIIIRNKDKVIDITGHPFETFSTLRIYVPQQLLASYLSDERWRDYRDYIVSDSQYKINKVVTVSEPGKLAEALGLSCNMSEVMPGFDPQLYYLRGQYAKYDSLTISGPLNGLDLGVLRYMAGADVWDSNPTDGQLRYLNLWDAEIRKDSRYSYNCLGVDEYVEEDNVVPNYLFQNCTALETVILPKRAKSIGKYAFERATSLKRVCVGAATKSYGKNILNKLSNIEELVLLTDEHATTDNGDAWGADIALVSTLSSQLGDYMGDPSLWRRAHMMTAPIEDEAAIRALADKGHFFPGEYLLKERMEDVFSGNSSIRTFDDFKRFQSLRQMDATFRDATGLQSITLPNSLESIGADAFAGCRNLSTIRIRRDTVPALAENAFRDLAGNFRIYVPKQLCKLYRTKWAQYADHINVDTENYSPDKVITVTVDKPNTLAEKLGLKMTLTRGSVLSGLSGNYSEVRKLKVIGPISGNDFDVLKTLAGYSPHSQKTNMAGQLEYIDLYDADIRESTRTLGQESGYHLYQLMDYGVADNELPIHAFLKANKLKTLILPKSCTAVSHRAMEGCENLETLVVGDDTKEFNWNALDDDANLTRLYILSSTKLSFDKSAAARLWDALCNNYNPTFDAFYVRPSLYQQYIRDPQYTGTSWQRTNNISKGAFDDDESFCAFASHAAANYDDLATINSVEGWFRGHEGIRDLTPLRYTAVDSLSKAAMEPLTNLERIALPFTLTAIEEGTFSKAANLHYADMLSIISPQLIERMKNGGLQKMGINTQQTLVYAPAEYGETDETNVVTGKQGSMRTKTYRMMGDWDYLVPYAFEAGSIENSRTLPKSSMPYTVCLPYQMDIPAGARAYELDSRNSETLSFRQVTDRLTPMKPYLMVAETASASLGTTLTQTLPTSTQAVLANIQTDVLGYTLRGTLATIDNHTAADMGAFILQSDGLWHPVFAKTDGEKSAVVLPFRAYLLPNANNRARVLGTELIDTDGTTGISTIRTTDSDGTERLYDLNGRRIESGSRHKGVVIRNGRKYNNQ